MMHFPPNSRFRFYGSSTNYGIWVKDSLRGGPTADEASLIDYERRVCETVGTRHAIPMPQCRVALYMALRSLLAESRRKVIMSPYTIHDIVNMVICAGGVPLFADIERETCNIDSAEIEELLSDTEVGAVLVTHLHGLACDMERIVPLCKAAGVPLIEDCAQAYGTRIGGRSVGGFGDVGIFSTGMAKVVNSLYGGMLTTNEDRLADSIRREMASFSYQSNQLLSEKIRFTLVGDVLTFPPVFWAATNWVFRFGYLNEIEALNKRVRGEDDPRIKRVLPPEYLRRMTPMQARMALAQLPDVDANATLRIATAFIYHQGLADIPDIIIPPFRNDFSHTYQVFPIQVENRHDLLRHLMKHGRDLTVQHLSNNADAACFAEFHRDCPRARATADQVLLLPTYPTYGINEARKNVEFIRRYFGR